MVITLDFGPSNGVSTTPMATIWKFVIFVNKNL